MEKLIGLITANYSTKFPSALSETRPVASMPYLGRYRVVDFALSNMVNSYVVHGPNRITALPMEVPVCYQEIAHCLDKTIAKIENAVLSALENTPPELYADIVKNGIYLTGGGALLRGLDRRLQEKISIPFHIAEDPLHSVAKGAGIALKNVERFSFLMR